jgi:hypothetical protein
LAELQAKLKATREKAASKPVPAAKKPTIPGGKPMPAAKKPSIIGAKPAILGGKPVPATKKPILPGGKPAVASKKPVIPGGKPTAVAKKPPVPPAAAPRKVGGNAASPPKAQPRSKPRRPSQGADGKRATAAHAAADSSELSFEVGAVIIQLGTVPDANGRVKAMLADGKMGLAPLDKLA